MQQMEWFLRVLALRSVKPSFVTALSCIAIAIFSGNAYAADMQTILTNVSNIIMPLTNMLLAISFASGVYMIFNALTQMKKFGNMSMQAQPGELGGPLMKLIVGTVLIYLPTATDAMTNSFFGDGGGASLFGWGGSTNYQNLGSGATLLNYGGGSDSFGQQWASLANTLVMYIQFLGLLSMLKGWFILSKSAGQGAQPGSVGKGVTHIIGGIVAMNFVGVIGILNNTIFGTG